MAEAAKNGNGNSIEVPTPFGGKVKLSGPLVIVVVCLAAMIAGLGYWAYWEIQKRDKEFEAVFTKLNAMERHRDDQLSGAFNDLSCRINIAIFLHQFPKGQVDWSLLPADMWRCVPNFKMK